jgi:hypothetical protein
MPAPRTNGRSRRGRSVPNQYAIIFASGKNRTPPQAVAGQDNPGTLAQPRLHTLFSLSKDGGYLALKEGQRRRRLHHADRVQPVSRATRRCQLRQLGYRRLHRLHADADAGAGQRRDRRGFREGHAVQPSARALRGAFNLAITTATPGATIRYTTNGSEPAVNTGTVYTGPIPISATTVVRAAAFKAGWKPTNVDTQTYLFIDDIVNQSNAHATALGFPSGSVNGQIFRYGMTLGNVTSGGGNLQALKNALAAAPAVCLTTDVQNLVNASTGIYVNPSTRGLFWERPASVEYLNAAGTSEFQIDCGARIRGGFSRTTTESEARLPPVFPRAL